MLLDVLTGNLTFDSLSPCDLNTCTKSEIRAYFENSYDLNESLFTSLKDAAAMFHFPDRLRLPLIFYYGHTAVVYINKLILAGLIKAEERIDLELEMMFETGVDEMSWDDTENYRLGGKFLWPTLERVVDYRRKVRNLILKVIDETQLKVPITMESSWWGLFMGMEHERIHLETSSVLIRQLPVDMVHNPDGWRTAPTQTDVEVFKNPMLSVEESEVAMGKPRDFPTYGWDNEYGHVECKVPAFKCSKYMVTNREFLEFVMDGGYRRRTLWTDEGWAWVSYRQAKHPTFWMCSQACKSGCGGELSGYSHCSRNFPDRINNLTNGQNSYCNGHSTTDNNGHQGKDEGGGIRFRFRTMFEELSEVPWDWPAEVNYHEAKAFCRWRGPGFRLPCEAEHHVIRGDMAAASEGFSSDMNHQLKNNINMKFGSPSSVFTFPATSLGFHDVFGNVWEWMEDHFNGLPEFQTDPLYDDFSTPTFDGRHNTILGGSWISTGDEASRFARYAFRRHFFQHAGFRVVRSEEWETKTKLPVRIVTSPVYQLGAGFSKPPVHLENIDYVEVETTNTQYLYDRDDILAENLRFEYGQKNPLPVKLAQKADQVALRWNTARSHVLHLGANCGRGSFELSKSFNKVLAQDFCGVFIETCLQLQSGDVVTYSSFNGFKKSRVNVAAPEDANPDRITFSQLTWLPNEVGSFDFILAGSLDRVQNVQAWTLRIPDVLRPDGILMIASTHWTKERLLPLLNKRLTMHENCTIPYSHAGHDYDAYITVWKHNKKHLQQN